MKNIFNRHFYTGTYIGVLYRVFIMLIFMQITRWGFYAYNYEILGGLSWSEIFLIFFGGFRFDLTAVLYFNIIYILMRILPFRFIYNKGYIKASNWVYGICNSLALAMNVFDAPFYRFTGMRTQAVHVSEIFKDSNTFDVIWGHLHTYWVMAILFLLFISLFLWIANLAQPRRKIYIDDNDKRLIIIRVLLFLAFGTGTFLGIRGNIQAGYPIGVADAMLYVDKPKEVSLVLNTPFSILRTIGKNNTLESLNLVSQPVMNRFRGNNIHKPDTLAFNKKNVVLIILEGVGTTYIDSLNRYIQEKPLFNHQLTPFLNNLAQKSHVFMNFFANCRRSSAGITSILGGFPAYNPFVYMLSPYSRNDVDGVAKLLGQEGYDSRFLCGCNQGSYAFSSMSKAFGYKGFIDRVEYMKMYGDKDYDGSWGIYDSAMAPVLLNTIDNMKQPFIASWFTLNTHGPFTIPNEYKGRFKSPDKTMAQTVEYIDDVLKQFFQEASKKPWYKNTIFIITADHGSLSMDENALYDSDVQLYRIPLMIFTPDGSVLPDKSYRIGSQMDIGPTILDLVNYPKQYFSLGSSIYDMSKPRFALFDANRQYNFVQDEYVLKLNMIDYKPTELFNYITDPLLKQNLINSTPDRAKEMELQAKSFLQDHNNSIINDKMSVVTTK